MDNSKAIRADKASETPLRDLLINEAQWTADLDYCMSCRQMYQRLPLERIHRHGPPKGDSPGGSGRRTGRHRSILRLLHPICPFITESLHERLKDFEATPVVGLALKPAELCTSAGWPVADASLHDEAAEAEFERMRELIGAIRETRSQRNVQPKRQIVLHTDAETLAQIEKAGALVPTLCGLERIVTEPASGDQAVITALGKDHAVSNLTDALDAGAEKQRLEKNLAEVAGKITGLQKRLSNPGYVDKAPAHLVEQTRGQLTQLEEEQKTIETALAKLS